MAPRIRLHVSLRLFMLLCLGSSLILAWLGLVHQRREFTSRINGVNRWTRISDSSELLGDPQNVIGASIGSKEDLAALVAKPEVCAQIEYLSITAPEAFAAWAPGDFPRLKKVSLWNVDLGNNRLAKLSCLSHLTILFISELQHDPVPALNDLTHLAGLQHMVLRAGSDVRWADFPNLPQLRTLQVSSSDVSADELERLRARLPNCELVAPDS